MGGKSGAGENPFRTGAQNTPVIEPAQAEDGAIMSTDETRNADYASDFEQRLNRQNQGESRKKMLKLVAALIGVLALAAVVALFLKTQNFGVDAVRKQNAERLYTETSTLFNLLTTGEYKAGEVKASSDEEDLYIQKIIDASSNNKAKDRKEFFNNLSSSTKKIRQQLESDGGSVGLSDLNSYIKALTGFIAMEDVFKAYSGIDYSDDSNFVGAFVQNGQIGIEQELLDNTLSPTVTARDKMRNSEDGENFVNMIEGAGYREALEQVDDVDELLVFMYYMNLDYVERLSVLLTLYQEAGCIQDENIDEVCRLNTVGSGEGVEINASLIEIIQYIKDFMGGCSEDFVDTIGSLKIELDEARR